MHILLCFFVIALLLGAMRLFADLFKENWGFGVISFVAAGVIALALYIL